MYILVYHSSHPVARWKSWYACLLSPVWCCQRPSMKVGTRLDYIVTSIFILFSILGTCLTYGAVMYHKSIPWTVRCEITAI